MKNLILTTFIVFISFFASAQDGLFENLSQFTIGSDLIDVSSAIAYDQTQDMIVVGTFRGSMDFDPSVSSDVIDPLGQPDIFVAKYQSDGSLLWAFNLGRISLDNGMDANGLAIDDDNNILISGSFSSTVDFDPSANVEARTSTGGKDAFLAKYSPDGGFIWVQTYGSIYYEYGEMLGLGSNGDIYFSIRYNGEIDVDPGAGEVLLTPQPGASDAALVKYNAAGEYQWNYVVSTPDNDNITCISIASEGKIGLGSTINGALSGFAERDMQLSMLNADGTEAWSFNFNNYEKANTIREIKFTDDNANIFVAGRIEGDTDFDPDENADLIIDPLFADPFIAKYSVSNGALIWARNIVSAGTEDFLNGITESGTAVIVSGSFDVSATFDPGDFSTQFASAGGSDIYVAAYDRMDGSYIDAKTFGGEGSEVSTDAHYLPNGNMAMTGVFTTSIQLNSDESPVASNGYSDVFFAEFSYQINVSDNLKPLAAKQAISVYPVPASNVLFINVENAANAPSVSVTVFNVVGQIVKERTFDFSSGKRKLDVSDLKSGVYIIEFDSDGKRISKRFVKQ